MTQVQVQKKAFTVAITATTEIAASPERVWQVLSDTAAYPEWNPFVRRLDGSLELGSRISVDLQPGQKKPQTMQPKIVDFKPGHTFTWLGHVGVPGLLDGRHTFTVEPYGDGARLIQHEVLCGALTPLFRSMLTRDTPRAFLALNDALARRAGS
jgi:hypothetical protein